MRWDVTEFQTRTENPVRTVGISRKVGAIPSRRQHLTRTNGALDGGLVPRSAGSISYAASAAACPHYCRDGLVKMVIFVAGRTSSAAEASASLTAAADRCASRARAGEVRLVGGACTTRAGTRTQGTSTVMFARCVPGVADMLAQKSTVRIQAGIPMGKSRLGISGSSAAVKSFP
jgi:hypothetical protein